MKAKCILITAILGFALSACHDLELAPIGQLFEPELYGNEYGVKKLLTRFYNYLPIEDFDYYHTSTGYFGGSNAWEAYKYSQAQGSGECACDWGGVNNNINNYWAYDRLREINTFILTYPKFKENFLESTYNTFMGEARFLRAFIFFGMVKRYGGIPIITEIQDPLAPLETLQVPRNTEYECWKFIYDDLKFAIDNMPETRSGEPWRANKYIAAALMSRAMLYAGSSAQYTQYAGYDDDEAVVGGFAGMTPDKAQEFFQYSYDASNLIINSGQYSLYMKYPDNLAENFAQIFLDKTSPENIFVEVYYSQAPGGTQLRHCYDAMMSPVPDMASDVGSHCAPTLELMMLYDFPALTTAPNGLDTAYAPIRFNDKSDFAGDNVTVRSVPDGKLHTGTHMEPRLKGTVYFDGMELRGYQFDVFRGIYLTYPSSWTAGFSGNGDRTPNVMPNSDENRKLGSNMTNRTFVWADAPGGSKTLTTAGRHGIFNSNGSENNTYTGVYTRKYIDPNLPASKAKLFQSETDWIVFRLGEIYLNAAEAAYELGKRQEAFDKYIQPIRHRAGCIVENPYKGAPADVSQMDTLESYPMYRYTNPYPIDENLQFIRDERYRELAYENHRFWDLRRWRNTDAVLNNYRPRALMAYYIADEDKWIYLNHYHKGGKTYTSSKESYWAGISSSEITKNPNLLPRNPGR